MPGIIMYRSRYGSTAEYAGWVRDETGYDLCEAKGCPRDLTPYDTVVLASRVMAGRLVLAGWIRAQWSALRGKRVFILMTHMVDDPQLVDRVIPDSLPAEIAEAVQVYRVPGRYLVSRMSFGDRLLLKIVSSMVKDPKVKRELQTDRDMVDRSALQPLLRALRG